MKKRIYFKGLQVRKWILLLALFSGRVGFAQDTTTLFFDAFYDQVLRYHPISQQALLLPQVAKAELRSARGAFDPSLLTSIDSKKTNGIQSYTYVQPQLKVPTLIGVDIKAGMDQSMGTSVNPELAKYDYATGQTKNVQYQLFYAGVSVPVLRGLLTDSRRNQLRQAELLKGLNEAEQISQINKLLLSAAKAYWDWQQNYARLQIMRENFELAKNRKAYIVSRILGGEEKPIDSVEAYIECIKREAMLAETELEFLNSSVELSTYLWDNTQTPIQLAPTVKPSAKGSEIHVLSLDSVASLSSHAYDMHPDVQKMMVKLKQSQLDRKLAVENLKPQLNLEYYPFQTYTSGSKDVVDGLLYKNYKFGVTFYSSLFLRKERGKLDLTNYKIQQNEFGLKQGRRDVQANVLESYNSLTTCQKLIEIQTQLVQNTYLMRNAEEMRFKSGESSLFLVNQRERALLEAQSKLAELVAKYAKAKYHLQWASGTKLF
ncbi:MAG: hypothetical protein CFE21_10585 [Bacteroidetes bacterium B1(2017)]|nr:MAG: hypothetical protein CFE21_10585 [Bacteroidetes bacterium B1(2017)]